MRLQVLALVLVSVLWATRVDAAEIPVISSISAVQSRELVDGRYRVVRTPVDATPSQCTEGGDYYANDGSVILIISNNGASQRKVARLAQNHPLPAETPDEVAIIDPGEAVIAAPVHPKWFNDATGKVQVRYEAGAAADLTILAIRSADVR